MLRRAPFILVALLTFGILSIFTGAAFGRQEEDKNLRPSPPASARCKLANGKTISVDYSSPRMRGRKIFGGLVPYGEVWRAGANEATTLAIDGDMTVGDKSVPAGHYTLFTLPMATKWTLIISKETAEWGIPYPGAEHDFTRTDMNVSKLKAPLQNFTISFDETGSACTMKMDWDTTQAAVEIAPKK